jgi:hypothetical protein
MSLTQHRAVRASQLAYRSLKAVSGNVGTILKRCMRIWKLSKDKKKRGAS